MTTNFLYFFTPLLYGRDDIDPPTPLLQLIWKREIEGGAPSWGAYREEGGGRVKSKGICCHTCHLVIVHAADSVFLS